MVVALGPGKFYGSGLPRPRFFSDVQLNDERVDPPTPVLGPLISWANEAHWSMGGLSFQHHRLQGRIEGSVKKLREQQDRSRRKKKKAAVSAASTASVAVSAPPVPAVKVRVSGVKPISLKAIDSDSSESSDQSEEIVTVTPSPVPKRKRARKLMDEFEVAAAEESKKKSIGGDDVVRVSPRKYGNEKIAHLVSSRKRSRGSPLGRKEAAGVSVVVRRTSPRKSIA